MSMFRGFIIRILEIASYLGIAAFTVAGAMNGGYLLFAFTGLGLGNPRAPALVSSSAIAGGVAGFVAGALTFGILLLLIDIRENTRR